MILNNLEVHRNGRLLVFVFFEVIIHDFEVHQAEGPVHTVALFTTFHQPVELAEVAFVSEVEGKSHGWVALR